MAALEAAGIRAGQLGQALGRHFSLRDLIKWCHRMQVMLGCPQVLRDVAMFGMPRVHSVGNYFQHDVQDCEVRD